MEFPTDKFKARRDSYAKTRGGSSKFLYIACANCEEPFMVYQKDGPGSLLRCYADRIVWPPDLVDAQRKVTTANIKSVGALACAACGNILATPMIYAPEDRPAYRVIPGKMHAYRNPPAPSEVEQSVPETAIEGTDQEPSEEVLPQVSEPDPSQNGDQ